MKRLYLVRHAPANWPENEPAYRGWSDAPLSAAGARQAERIADRIAGEPGVSAVYASDLARSVETARVVAKRRGLEVRILEGLREISFGLWEGRSHDELEADKRYRAWLAEPLCVAPPGGEAFPEFARRVEAAFGGIRRAESEDAGVVVVGHGGSLRVIVCGLLGMPPENHWRVRLDHSSVTVFNWAGDLPVLESLNDLLHLRDGGTA